MKRGRISEPSTWGGLAAMCIGLMPMLPDQFQPALAVAGPSGLVSPHAPYPAKRRAFVAR